MLVEALVEVEVLVLVQLEDRVAPGVQSRSLMEQPIEMPHERLLAYQYAIDRLKQVQELGIRDARLRDQICRAAKSTCLNIAEGVGRVGDGDKKRVYAIARGECCETAAAIDIAIVSGDVDAEPAKSARSTAGRVYALLTGLMRRYDLRPSRPK